MAASSRKHAMPPILIVELSQIPKIRFQRYCVGCIVLSQDGKIVLQERDALCPTFPECLATFGGGIDLGETPMEALVRELKEELGAEVNPKDVISLGAITEAATNHAELIYVFFWHDKKGSISGCYEGRAKYYDLRAMALRHPKVMSDVVWLLTACQQRHLLK